MKILLFDVDSVLLDPLGYRLGIPTTLQYFTEQLGWEPLGPDAEEIERMEAHGISSEWDTVAVLLAGWVSHALADFPHLWTLPPDLADALTVLQAAHLATPRMDSVAWVGRVMAATLPGEAPALAALRLLKAETPAQAHAFFAGVLENTRSVTQSLTTRIFQHYMLGDTLFASTYGRAPEISTPSLLQQADRALLSVELAHQLQAQHAQGGHFAAIYTARPSLPPRDAQTDALGYSPEAELACELVGLDELPIVAYGRVQWLAAQTGALAEEYAKPQPTQALAAIGAAISGQESAALTAALALVQNGVLQAPLTQLLNQPVEIYIFEDSARSIRGVQTAASLLRQQGVQAQAFGMGIDPFGPKQPVLTAAGAQVFADVNQALGSVGY